jgi:hypothetical protein
MERVLWWTAIALTRVMTDCCWMVDVKNTCIVERQLDEKLVLEFKLYLIALVAMS